MPARTVAPRTPPVSAACGLHAPALEYRMECPPLYAAPHYRGSGKLQGMTALITGGDSGIGRAVALLFAREGAHVAIAYLHEHKDAKATRQLVEAEGAQCLLLAGDVREPDWCQRAVRKVVKAWGKLNILVNNAACQVQAESLEKLPPAQLQATLHTNVGGYIYMAQAALPHMRQGDCIINTSSTTGLAGCPCAMDYAASKGAIHAFTKSLAQSVAERGIRVNAIAPGPVWTALSSPEGSADDFANFGADTPLGRGLQPEDVAPAYVFLAAPVCAALVTGVILPITADFSL